MSSQEPTKWKRFEQKAYEIQKSITSAHADVKLNDSIHGVDSTTDRQIDISIRTNIGSYSILIVVECKDYKTPIDVPKVEAFISLSLDKKLCGHEFNKLRDFLRPTFC